MLDADGDRARRGRGRAPPDAGQRLRRGPGGTPGLPPPRAREPASRRRGAEPAGRAALPRAAPAGRDRIGPRLVRAGRRGDRAPHRPAGRQTPGRGTRRRGSGRRRGLLRHPPTPTEATDGRRAGVSADGKGIVMRPDALRPRPRPRPPPPRPPSSRPACPRARNATANAWPRSAPSTTCAPVARTADRRARRQRRAAQPRPRRSAPRAKNKWLTASVVDDAAEVVAAVFDEAERRDPDHQRTWVALVDGNNHQIDRIQAEAATRGIDVPIVVDLIHVLEYLWGAAWCFFPEGDPAAETWVRQRALAILDGNATQVAAGIRRRATKTGLSRPNAPRPTTLRRLPGQQGQLPRLPHRPRRRLADRHRRHRGRLPPPGQGPHGHHRSPLERHRRRSRPQAPRRPQPTATSTPTGNSTSTENDNASTESRYANDVIPPAA